MMLSVSPPSDLRFGRLATALGAADSPTPLCGDGARVLASDIAGWGDCARRAPCRPGASSALPPAACRLSPAVRSDRVAVGSLGGARWLLARSGLATASDLGSPRIRPVVERRIRAGPSAALPTALPVALERTVTDYVLHVGRPGVVQYSPPSDYFITQRNHSVFRGRFRGDPGPIQPGSGRSRPIQAGSGQAAVGVDQGRGCPRSEP